MNKRTKISFNDIIRCFISIRSLLEQPLMPISSCTVQYIVSKVLIHSPDKTIVMLKPNLRSRYVIKCFNNKVC